jgi:hypothetical protein
MSLLRYIDAEGDWRGRNPNDNVSRFLYERRRENMFFWGKELISEFCDELRTD